MRDDSRERFVQALTECAELYGETLTHARIEAYWRRLEDIHIDVIEYVIDAHTKDPERGRFFPKPADLFAQMEKVDDGRVTPDEAWAIALQASDESRTVVWTDEIAEAWGAARPILEVGDKVGARMAFLSAYRRGLAKARENGGRAEWHVSLGHDHAGRTAAVQKAIEQGRLREFPAGVLPSPDVNPGQNDLAVDGQRAGDEGHRITPMPQGLDTRERIARLRAVIASAAHRPEHDDAAGHEDSARMTPRERDAQRREAIEAERCRQLDKVAGMMERD